MDHIPGRQHAAPEVQPVIAEILRTCVYPAKLILRVEHIIQKPLDDSSDSESGTRSGHITKLFLTDGKLLIQALLHRKLSTLPEIEQLKVGDVVEIHRYKVKKAQRKNKQGHIVFLGIDSCYVIKAEASGVSSVVSNNTLSDVPGRKRKMSGTDDENEDKDIDDMAGGFCRPAGDETFQKRNAVAGVTVTEQLPSAKRMKSTDSTFVNQDESVDELSNQPQKHMPIECVTPKQNRSIGMKFSPSKLSESEEEGAFETVQIDLNTVRKRRQALHELSQNIVSSPSRPSTRESMSNLPEKATQKVGGSARPKLVSFEKTDGVNSQIVPEHSKEVPSPPGSHRHVHDNFNYRQNPSKSPSIQPGLLSAQPDSATSRPTTPNTLEHDYRWGPLHALSSLYSPSLPSKSYVFTALVIPTYVASHLISRPNSTFPPKRHIKVVDPSLVSKLRLERTNVLGKGITVSVYRDAVNFKPLVGRVALMRGIVMQRLNSAMRNGGKTVVSEVILNVYPEKSRIQKQSQSHGHNESMVQANNHQKGQAGTESKDKIGVTKPDMSSSKVEDVSETSWFIDDKNYLRQQGHDVDSMQHWWDTMMLGK